MYSDLFDVYKTITRTPLRIVNNDKTGNIASHDHYKTLNIQLLKYYTLTERAVLIIPTLMATSRLSDGF